MKAGGVQRCVCTCLCCGFLLPTVVWEVGFLQAMVAQELAKNVYQRQMSKSTGNTEKDRQTQAASEGQGATTPQLEVPVALKGLRILDVGCGGGILAEELCKRGASVLAIDASAQNIEVAEKHARAGGLLGQRRESVMAGPGGWVEGGTLEYRHMTAEELHAQGETFDVVVCSEVLEHVSDVAVMVGDLCRLVGRGQGALYITTLNRTPLSYGLGVVAAEQILGLVPRGTHDWNKFVTPEELEVELRTHGMEVRRLLGAAYNPLTDIWHAIPDTSVNYLAFCSWSAP